MSLLKALASTALVVGLVYMLGEAISKPEYWNNAPAPQRTPQRLITGKVVEEVRREEDYQFSLKSNEGQSYVFGPVRNGLGQVYNTPEVLALDALAK